jgi:predicted  nucleic acid-binding Zn-ribbon protein
MQRAGRAEVREVQRDEIEALERRIEECEEDRKDLHIRLQVLEDRYAALEKANRDLLVQLVKAQLAGSGPVVE